MRRNKEKQLKYLSILLASVVAVYCFTAFNVLEKISKLLQYSAYNFTDNMVVGHFDRFALDYDEKNENIDDILLDEINGQMYGINYLYKEGQKQALVTEQSKYLLDCIEYENEMIDKEKDDNETEEVKDEIKEEEYVEAMVPVKPANSITYSAQQLNDFNFLMSQLYIVPARAQVLETDLVADELLAKDMTIKGENDKPQILVYHTHSQEAFADSVAGQGMTIIQVGDYLTELLTNYGFNVIHCTDSFDVDANGNLDRSNAYVNALPAIQQILEDNPSIEVVLDIHRDGLPENVDKLVTNINGKQTAKIMFFNGLSRSSAAGEIDYLYNRYRSENLALSFQAKLKAMEYYPDFTRKNYLDAYQYNLHVKDKAMLIEVGAQNNTFEEAKNAMEPLSNILYMIFSGKG